ncbi:MAG TPA: hypothetical protein VN626_10895, partial [Clostridia bacterium]|nr:hypothetical protein [Clostridia bacterium]
TLTVLNILTRMACAYSGWSKSKTYSKITDLNRSTSVLAKFAALVLFVFWWRKARIWKKK